MTILKAIQDCIAEEISVSFSRSNKDCHVFIATCYMDGEAPVLSKVDLEIKDMQADAAEDLIAKAIIMLRTATNVARENL